jgi:hypothetical protein
MTDEPQDERDALPAKEDISSAVAELDRSVPRLNDDRMVQRLEEQLRDAHATNAGLRERVAEADKIELAARAKASEAAGALLQLEKAHARQKAAEDRAAAAERKAAAAEQQAAHLQGKLEEANELLDAVRTDARILTDLNERIANAQHAGHLFALGD